MPIRWRGYAFVLGLVVFASPRFSAPSDAANFSDPTWRDPLVLCTDAVDQKSDSDIVHWCSESARQASSRIIRDSPTRRTLDYHIRAMHYQYAAEALARVTHNDHPSVITLNGRLHDMVDYLTSSRGAWAWMYRTARTPADRRFAQRGLAVSATELESVRAALSTLEKAAK